MEPEPEAAGIEQVNDDPFPNRRIELENVLGEARAELNTYLEPYPKSLKIFLVKEATKFMKQVKTSGELKGLLNGRTDPSKDEIDRMKEHISASFTQLFIRIGNYLDLLEEAAVTEELAMIAESDVKRLGDSKVVKLVDQAYIFRLISNYLNAQFHEVFAQLTNKEVADFPIGDIIKDYKWITPRDLDVHLKEEDENVRICMYTAIRALSSMDLVTSPHGKVDCISEFFNTVYISLAKSASAAGFGQTNSSTISADDLLPAVVYVILKSKSLNIPFHLKYIESWIGNQSVLQTGQTGYEFTTMCSAVEVIRNLNIVPPKEPGLNDEKFFMASVEIIHREVSTVWKCRVQEIVETLKRAQLENTKLLSKQISDAKERKAWNVIKWIPGLNFTYGGIRGIYYGIQKNKKEAMNSLIGTCGGIFGLGAGIAGALVGGPLIVPIIVSIVSGSATNQVITGGGEVLYDVHQNSERFQSLTMDEQEKEIYDRIIKDISIVGMCYSTIRAPVYLIKGNKAEAKHSGVNAVVNAGASAAGVAAGYAFARLATNLAGAASSAVDVADDVVKPLATEIVDLVAAVGVKVVTSTSTNTVIRIGTSSVTRMTIEGMCSHEEETELF